MLSRLVSPRISIDSNGVPSSEEIGDIYFPRNNIIRACEESYIIPNRISERAKSCLDTYLVELGLGTGLNFLLTTKLWAKETKGSWLNYLAIEAFPLNRQQLKQILSKLVPNNPFVKEFIKYFPHPFEGVYRLDFPEAKVRLYIYLMDCDKALAELENHSHTRVDAWYLDGFDPKKNPSMWKESVLDSIARLSNDEATLGTYSVVGDIRRGLESRGFEVSKVSASFGKREILKGVLKEQSITLHVSRPVSSREILKPSKKIGIVGAGVAGLALSYCLSLRGAKVKVFEAKSSAVTEGSGSSAGIVSPYLGLAHTPRTQFLHEAFHFTFNKLKSEFSEAFKHCGSINLPFNQRLRRFVEEGYVNNFPDEMVTHLGPEELSKLSGVSIKSDGLYLPEAGVFYPKIFLKILLSQGLELFTNYQVVDFKPVGNSIQLSFDGADVQEFDCVIFCNSHWLKEIPQAYKLQLSGLSGQSINLEASSSSKTLKTILSYGGALTPSFLMQGKEVHYCGSSYRFEEDSSPEEEASKILQKLEDSELKLSFSAKDIYSNHRSYRCTTPDRLPRVDSISNPNVFALVGLGSRGFSSAFYLAEILAEEIFGGFTSSSEKVKSALKFSKNGKT